MGFNAWFLARVHWKEKEERKAKKTMNVRDD